MPDSTLSDTSASATPAPGTSSAAITPAALRRRVAELLVVRASGHLGDDQRRWPRWELDNASLRRLLAEGVGGVILLGASAAELRLRTDQLRAWAGGAGAGAAGAGGPDAGGAGVGEGEAGGSGAGARPGGGAWDGADRGSAAGLLLCADVEEGVGQRFEGASWLVPPLALGRLHRRDPAGALAAAERYGRCTAREARAVGLNWVLAPVCDVNNNPANPVINVRAWGEDPDTAGALATAFCRGLQAEGVLGCAKHFPGHGDTAADSHLELPLIPHDRQRLEAIELPPFRATIAAGVASVMTAHLLLPALDPERPATLSAAVLTDLLRRDLGFSGLVVTDALVMEAITGRWGAGEAAVLALEAGADLVLMPADADEAIAAIVAAVQQGRLSLERIDASRERRRRALAAVAPQASAGDGSPLGPLSEGPAEEDRRLALQLVQASVEHQGAPIRRPGAEAAAVNLVRLDTTLVSPFLSATAPALVLPEGAGFRSLLLDNRSLTPWRPSSPTDPQGPLDLERLGSGPVLLQLFVRGNPFRGSAGGGQEPWAAAVRQLLEAGRLAGLALYGSPYLWEALRPLLPPELPAGWSAGQMPLAQTELLARLGLGDGSGSDGFTD